MVSGLDLWTWREGNYIPYRFRLGNFFPRNLSNSSLLEKSFQIFFFFLSPSMGFVRAELFVST